MRLRIGILFYAAALTLTGCSPLKKLTENEALVNQNIIRVEKKPLVEELEPIIKQKPNKKIFNIAFKRKSGEKRELGIRFHLLIYNLANTGKTESERFKIWYRFKAWMRNTVGEAPVILDTALTRTTAQQMQLYLKSKGYFNASVRDSIVTTKRKQVNVFYLVDLERPYVIDSISYHSEDEDLLRKVIEDTLNSHLKRNKIYDEALLQQERDRIARRLREAGYYTFGREYIHYEVDSSLGSHKVNLYLKIDRINENTPVKVPENFNLYLVRNVYIQTEYDPKRNDSVPPDTLDYLHYKILYSSEKPPFKSNLLAQNIFIKPGSLYNASDVEDTYQRLGQLGVFRFINIRFATDSSHPGYIDCQIQLTPLPRQSFTIVNEFTHNSGISSGLGNLGVGGNTNYQNKNTFRGAELIEFKIKGGLEAQTSTIDEDEGKKTFFLFNTVEVGPELNFTFHKFLLPFRIEGISKRANPRTTITTAYNYQLRPLFRRSVTNVSINYEWLENRFKKHIISPLDINGIKIDNNDSLLKILKNINDRFLLVSYSSHLTTATRYTYVFNDQESGRKKTVKLFTANLELAGNSLSAFNKLANTIENETGTYLLFGLRYAQYTRADVDLRLYRKYSPHSTLAYRIGAGIGIPYGNSSVLPLEKSYFSGGANSIRAWQFRRLGPGSYRDTLFIDQPGDIKFEANIEHRFDIFRISRSLTLQGATFLDAGNIWAIKKDLSRPGAGFTKETFYREIAIAGGAGVRFNFGIFILRLDYALRLRDPSFRENERWRIQYLSAGKGVFNLGIGYPF